MDNLEERIIGESDAIKNLRMRISRAARTDAVVLVQGETGTGKELVARAVHRESSRREKAFVAVNSGAIPESLAESILFGYEGGAFSGSRKGGKAGLLEQADGGTLFLDEASEMPPSLQTLMLRTLQNQRIRRVGGNDVHQLDVRIIAATNKNLQDAVESGAFREDLFYRLDVIPLAVPALRERKGDIPLLVDYFLKYFGEHYGKEYVASPSLVRYFETYHWPGNVRQLKNFIEYGVCFSEKGHLTIELLEERFNQVRLTGNPYRSQGGRASEIRALLARYGNTTKAKRRIACELGISLSTLYRRLGASGA